MFDGQCGEMSIAGQISRCAKRSKQPAEHGCMTIRRIACQRPRQRKPLLLAARCMEKREFAAHSGVVLAATAAHHHRIGAIGCLAHLDEAFELLGLAPQAAAGDSNAVRRPCRDVPLAQSCAG